MDDAASAIGPGPDQSFSIAVAPIIAHCFCRPTIFACVTISFRIMIVLNSHKQAIFGSWIFSKLGLYLGFN